MPSAKVQNGFYRNGSDMDPVLTVIGLMSGTSMDGIDVALLKTDGETVDALGPTRTFAYAGADRTVLAAAMEAAKALTDRNQRPEPLAAAERLVTLRHVEAVRQFLDQTGLAAADVDLIGFHGQTVFHDPAHRLTVQLGHGGALARALGIDVAWDFRAADVAAGGQGAPLAPAFHGALARHARLELPVAVLNIGGVANVTWIGAENPANSGPETIEPETGDPAAGALMAFDTGPGNALIDDWMRKKAGLGFDRNGGIARSGVLPNDDRLLTLMSDSYFEVPPPKSLDRNHFSLMPVEDLQLADGARVLVCFTVSSIARAPAWFPAPPKAWIVTGGGRHNGYMMEVLRRRLGTPVHIAEDIGLDGDAVEAQAFAYLAARTGAGKPITFPGTTGVDAPMAGGRISRFSDRA
jgi:anhydro-N-acetylmuramic acid kinase